MLVYNVDCFNFSVLLPRLTLVVAVVLGSQLLSCGRSAHNSLGLVFFFIPLLGARTVNLTPT